MQKVNNCTCVKCGSKTEDRFRVMNNVICEDCVELHTKGDMPDTCVYNFLKFIVEDLKITNLIHIHNIFNDNKNFFIDAVLKETYDECYTNITFENYKENFVELLFDEVFRNPLCTYNIIEDNKFYVIHHDVITDEKLLEIEKEINTYKKDYITYLIEYMTDNDYTTELEKTLIEFQNAGYYRGTK